MKLTLEDKLKIIELRQQGYSYEMIGKQFKVRDSTIKRICYCYKEHEVEGIIHPPKNRIYSAELKLEIINKVFRIDMFVSGIGTGGTLIGIAKRIKEVNDNAFILALEPLQLPIITEGVSIGKHKIEGIGDDFIPNIVDFDLISNVVAVDDEDAINMARILAKRFGLGVGISMCHPSWHT